jgi:hypothetical protein
MTTYLPFLELTTAQSNVANQTAIVSSSVPSTAFSGSISDSYLATISTSGKVASSANATLTNATNLNTESTLAKRSGTGNVQFAQVKLVNGSFTTTLVTTTLTADRTYTLQDADGVVATLTDAQAGGGSVTINDATSSVGSNAVSLSGGALTFGIASGTTSGLVSITEQFLNGNTFLVGKMAVNRTTADAWGAELALSDNTGNTKLVFNYPSTASTTNFTGIGVDSTGLLTHVEGSAQTVCLASFTHISFNNTTTSSAIWGATSGISPSLTVSGPGSSAISWHRAFNIENTIWHCGTGGSGTTATLTLKMYQYGPIVWLVVPNFSFVTGNTSVSFIEMYNASQNASSKTLPALPSRAVKAGEFRLLETATYFPAKVMIQTNGSIQVYKSPTPTAFNTSATITVAESTVLTYTTL